MDSTERIARLEHVLSELVTVVAQLNAETYEMATGPFDRIPPKPRVEGYPRLESVLKELSETLERKR